MQNNGKSQSRLFEFFRGGNKNDLRANPNAPRDFKYFFPLLGRRFFTIMGISVLYVLGNFPLFAALFALTGFANVNSTGAMSGAFAQLYGYMTAGGTKTPAFAALFGVYGVQGEVSLPTVGTYVLYGIAFVGLLITFGLVNVGAAHLLRSIVRESPIFFFSDFFDTVRKNLRQALLVGALDLLLCIALFYNFFFYLVNGSQTWSSVLFYFTIFLIFFYFIMRFYLYQMLITFDLSIRKLFKNALLFVMIGMKRNLVAFLAIAGLLVLNFFLLFAFMPIGAIFLLFFNIGLCSFIGAYCAYPKIKEIMIDPYLVKTIPVADGTEDGADGEVLYADLADTSADAADTTTVQTEGDEDDD